MHSKRTSRPRKKSRLTLAIEAWTARLLGAARSGESFSAQHAEYDSNRTSQDYIWNTLGVATWGMVFPFLTIVVTQLVGVERAGMFSFGFIMADLLMILANYGVRTFQVSDRNEAYAFIDYQVTRWVTVVVMLVVGYSICLFHGYTGEMFTMAMWLFVYRAIDGLADCYEGRLQQVNKLYLAGISQSVRCVLAFITFTVFLFITRDLGISAIAMAVVAALAFLVLTLPLTLFESPQSSKISFGRIGKLFIACFPVFIALFLYAVIDNMPKFMMESMLTYDNQLYFNALYFPAQAILLGVGFCYKPMLTRMADAWNDLNRRRRFDLLIVVALIAIAGFTGVILVVMGTIGLPLMTFMYGVDFEPFRKICYLMIIAGGITGGIDFLYQVFTVMRRQWAITKLYIITLAFSLAICYMLIYVSGLYGAVMSYLITMAILLMLLILEYIRIRMEYKRHPEDDPTLQVAKAHAQAQQADSSEGALQSQQLRKVPKHQPPEFSKREMVRQERIIREGGEADPRYRAWRSLQLRLQNRRDRK